MRLLEVVRVDPDLDQHNGAMMMLIIVEGIDKLLKKRDSDHDVVVVSRRVYSNSRVCHSRKRKCQLMLWNHAAAWQMNEINE